MKQSIAADGKHLFTFDRNDKKSVVIYTTNICTYFGIKFYPSIQVKTNLFFEILDKFHQKVTPCNFEKITEEIRRRFDSETDQDELFHNLYLMAGFYYVTTPMPFYLVDNDKQLCYCKFSGVLR